MSKNVLNSGMTITRLAQTANVPYSTVQEYFSGKKDIRKCSVGTFQAMAHALGMTMDGLYEEVASKDEGPAKKKYQGVRLPDVFRSCFWDRDFDNLDLDRETDFIIVRLFMRAGFKGVKYVEDTFTREDILHAIKTRRDLNPVVANFLKNRYNVRSCDMNYYTVVHDAGHDWR